VVSQAEVIDGRTLEAYDTDALKHRSRHVRSLCRDLSIELEVKRACVATAIYPINFRSGQWKPKSFMKRRT